MVIALKIDQFSISHVNARKFAHERKCLDMNDESTKIWSTIIYRYKYHSVGKAS